MYDVKFLDKSKLIHDICGSRLNKLFTKFNIFQGLIGSETLKCS